MSRLALHLEALDMNQNPLTLSRRQIWANPSSTSKVVPHSCSPFLLPSGGLLNLGQDNIVTLGHDAVFQPHCPSITPAPPLDPMRPEVDLSVLHQQDPFYTSTNPLIYAISAVTIVSYMLVIILFATPRTFYVGGVGGGVSLLGPRGASGASYGGNTVIGVGSRPWLQKLAASTLAISMTIVTADAFRYAEKQYNAGYEDAEELSRKIVDGLEIKIVRVVSESFLWLAQAQTLIRLFQRHREKLVIKWTAFVLISLEIVFTILIYFVDENNPHQPRAFQNSIPALNYLFALVLNICYAAFVIVFSLRKRRFAFYNPQMQSMPLIALLSLTAVLVPVIFFILDLSKPDVSGWGSYVRWVGACAASVVVWEWVERIETLEREEKKDGILGREVFDGDEMLDSSSQKRDGPSSPDEKTPGGFFSGKIGHNFTGKLDRLGRIKRFGRPKAGQAQSNKEVVSESGNTSGNDSAGGNQHQNSRTPNGLHSASGALSPAISRTHSTSSTSTVYQVRYHPTTEPTPPIDGISSSNNKHAATDQPKRKARRLLAYTPPGTKTLASPSRLARVPIPFRRQRRSPPAEVAAALADQQGQAPTPNGTPPSNFLGRMHLRRHPHPVRMPQGVIHVPAPPRRRVSLIAVSPEIESAAPDHVSVDEQSEGGDDRPPAVVRQAMRRSTPASPIVENIPKSNETAQAPSPAPLQEHTEVEEPNGTEALVLQRKIEEERERGRSSNHDR